MDIFIRADASVHIGSGHIMRCLVLAQALKDEGYTIYFVSRPQAGDLIQFVRDKGFDVYELPAPRKWLEPKNSADYKSWLQVSWQCDARDFLECVDKANLVIVDHYGVDFGWESQIRQRLKCKIFAIDDLVRKHDADLLLDQTFLREEIEYLAVGYSQQLLIGCDYALLNPLFSKYRKLPRDKCFEQSSPNVLITMGGIDKPNATYQTLFSLSQLDFRPKVTVLLGPNAPNYAQVKSFCEKNINWVMHVDFVENMAELMLNHDLAIGAPGSTSWERACLGIPCVVVPLAENQRTICKNLESVNAVVRVELDRIESDLPNAYKKILDNWSLYSKINLELCDGLGVQRVVQKIEQMLK